MGYEEHDHDPHIMTTVCVTTYMVTVTKFYCVTSRHGYMLDIYHANNVSCLHNKYSSIESQAGFVISTFEKF